VDYGGIFLSYVLFMSRFVRRFTKMKFFFIALFSLRNKDYWILRCFVKLLKLKLSILNLFQISPEPLILFENKILTPVVWVIYEQTSFTMQMISSMKLSI